MYRPPPASSRRQAPPRAKSHGRPPSSTPEIQAGLPPRRRAPAPPPRQGRAPSSTPEVQAGVPENIHQQMSAEQKARYFQMALRRREPLLDPRMANHHWREERAFLGEELFQHLHDARFRIRETLGRLNQPEATRGHGLHELSDEDLRKLTADLWMRQSGVGQDVDHAAKTVSPLGESLFNWFPETGKVLRGEHVNPYAAAGLIPVEFASLAVGPLKGPIGAAKGIFAGVRALRGGESLARAEEALAPEERRLLSLARANRAAGRALTPEQEQVLRRVESASRRASSAAAQAYHETRPIRTATAGALRVIRPAARSHTGRFLENFADLMRPALSKTGIVKGEAAVAGEEFGRQQLRERRLADLPAQELKRLSKRLSPEEQYAIRMVLEGTMPEDRAAAHLGWAGNSENPDLHLLHAYMAKRTGEFIEMGANGAPQLRVNAPKILKKALRQTLEVAQGRDELIHEMSALGDKALADRIQAPGRVVHGAQWKTTEAIINDALAQSPVRQQLRQALEQGGLDPSVVSAEVSMFDRIVRHAAETKLDDPEGIQQILSHLKGVERGDVVPPDALLQRHGWPNISHGVDETLKNGGHTWNQDYSDYNPVTEGGGYAVAVAPERGVQIPTNRFTWHDVVGFERKNRDFLEKNRGALKIGSWNDGQGKVHLDISMVVPDREQALELARREGQQAIFDFSSMQDIPVEQPVEALGKQVDQVFEGVGPETGARSGITPEGEPMSAWLRDALQAMREGKDVPPYPHDEPGSTTFPEDWLGQLQKATGYQDRIKGAVHFSSPEEATIYLTQHADASTFPHELAHVIRRFWLSDAEQKSVTKWATGKADGVWDRAAEEKFARGFEELLRRGVGPAGAKREFHAVSKALQDVYRQGMLPDLPPRVAEQLTKLFEHKQYPNTGRFVGADDFNLGVARVPYLRGVPVPHDAKMAATYARAIFNRGKVLGEPRDQTMLKAFKAGLLRSGYFQFKSAEPTAESLISAVRIFAAHRARPSLLEAAKTADGAWRSLPENVNDVPIKIDPKRPIGKGEISATEGVTRLQELMQQAEESGIAITEHDLEEASRGHGGDVFSLAEAAREDLLPGTIDGRPTRQVAEDFLAQRLNEPIENVAWLPVNFMDNTHLVPESYKPSATGLRQVAGQAGKIGLDVVNDVQRALVLYLNPVYIPVNLIGNAAMNVAQQGIFMPGNIYRGALLYRDLSHHERNMIDSLMGHGLIQSSAGSAMLRPVKKVTDPMAHYIGLLVDLQPRRLAFIHEARREGLDVAGIQKLLNDTTEQGATKRGLIAQRANDAIVDYERLSPFERNYLTRTLFFYPWLKGATRWTERWALDHPVQALVLALSGDHAYNAANEQLGARPEYAQMDMPISTKTLGLSVPGTGLDVGLDQAVGEHTMTNAQGLPEVTNIRQLFTQTTPIELAQAGLAFTTGWVPGSPFKGSNFPDLVNSLTPGLYASGVALFGYDPFLGREVPKGFGTFLKTLFSPESIPAVQHYKALTRSKTEQKNFEGRSLTPRSKGEELAHTFLGGLSNAPYNPEIGAQRILDTKGAYDRHLHTWASNAKDVGMRAPNDQETAELKAKLAFDHDIRRNAKGSDGHLDYSLAVKFSVDYYEKTVGDGRARAAYSHVRSVGQSKQLYDQLRLILFRHANEYERNLNHRVDQKLYSSSASP